MSNSRIHRSTLRNLRKDYDARLAAQLPILTTLLRPDTLHMCIGSLLDLNVVDIDRRDVDSHMVAKLGGDLFQGQTSSLWIISANVSADQS